MDRQTDRHPAVTRTLTTYATSVDAIPAGLPAWSSEGLSKSIFLCNILSLFSRYRHDIGFFTQRTVCILVHNFFPTFIYFKSYFLSLALSIKFHQICKTAFSFADNADSFARTGSETGFGFDKLIVTQVCGVLRLVCVCRIISSNRCHMVKLNSTQAHFALCYFNLCQLVFYAVTGMKI